MALRIGIDATPLLVTKTGIGKYTHELIFGLGQVAPENQYLLYANRPIPLDPKVCHTVKSTHYLPQSRWLWMQTILPYCLHQDQVDLLHFTNNAAPLRVSKPYVLTIHDASLFLFGQYHPLRRRIALRLLLPHAARQAAAIITVSEYAKQELQQELNLPAKKFHVVHQAAGEHFRPITDPEQRSLIRTRYQLPKRYILYVGTIEPRKNLPRLLQAFHAVRQQPTLKPIKLVLVGANGWMSDQLYEQIAKYDLTNHVQLLGYVPEADLPTLYSMATCFTFPSLHEGFGMPPLEAMACGVPVLTSQNSAMEEVCGDAASYVDPLDVESIASSLTALLSDVRLQCSLKSKGLQRARQYSWQRTAAATADVYRAVISSL